MFLVERIGKLSEAELRKIQVGLVDTVNDEIVYLPEHGLHEILAREVCSSYGWDFEGKGYISAVDYLLEVRDFMKVSNYGEGTAFRCLTVADSRHRSSKALREWLDYFSSTLRLRVDSY